MVLYKYVSHEAGMKILQSNSIGFSQPNNFNDPFELEAAYPNKVIENVVDAMMNHLFIWGKKSTWKRNTGILSLTRQPLNPLMWAHYCLNHTGMVIGLDTSSMEFTSEAQNIIPVQFGSVIYTEKRPNADFLSKPVEPLKVGETFHFSPQHLERLQRLFLFKPMCWSYEEEVRVAKCIKGIDECGDLISGSFTEIQVQGRPLYLLKLPAGTIKEVYVGVRSPVLGSHDDCDAFTAAVENYHPDACLYGCTISKSTWSIESFSLTDDDG